MMDVGILIAVVSVIAFVLIILAFFIGKKVGDIVANRRWEKLVPALRKDARDKSRHVLRGLFCEMLAPFFPDFNSNPNECRFVGKPIDFIVFEGMDEKNITGIKFVEVKSGQAKLSSIEKQVKDAIEKGKVKYEVYRIPENIK